ncbi:hypothetical protein [Winogradskyella jejuensis]|uniref:Uncharacterized protein n=1 Tax=Winogradskyella jejuensis TaxID=1089305 RepID=A0A1M5U0U9_9FLAO|nr:hypothetical protein [Winogradskyella jejuensis]SHH56619.1 hypothetical protein SAMN05444148_2330 [Winogradskyella jejuensis]
MEKPSEFNKEAIEAYENRPDNLSIKETVATHPLKSGGSNFRTHKLTEENSCRLVFRPTVFAITFSSIFIFIGLAMLYFGYTKYQNNETEYLLFFGGLLFFIVGNIILYHIYQPRVFDKKENIYYKGITPNERNSVPLSSIVALQIIGEIIHDDDGSYKSFEINLVLDDSSRKNVTDHGSLKSTIADAQWLSDFLKIPIWHASSHTED